VTRDIARIRADRDRTQNYQSVNTAAGTRELPIIALIVAARSSRDKIPDAVQGRALPEARWRTARAGLSAFP